MSTCTKKFMQKTLLATTMMLFFTVMGIAQDYQGIDIVASNCICSPGMDGSVSVIIDPDVANYEPAVPFTITITGPDNYSEAHIVWTAAELPHTQTFDNITDAGDYEIVVSNYYGCEVNFGIPVEDCAGIYPSVKRLRVVAKPQGGNELPVYDAQWNLQGDCIAYEGGSIPVQLDNPSTTGLEVFFIASEDLVVGSVSVSLPGTSDPNGVIDPINTYTYKATFPSLTAADIQDAQQILVTGQNAAGQELLDLRTMSSDLVDCVQLPQFTDDCSISAGMEFGTDDVHIFEIKCLDVDAELTYPSNFGANDGAIELTIEGTPPYTITWTLITGQPYNTAPNAQSVFGLASEKYCALVEDSNGCTFTDCWNLYPCTTKKIDFTYEETCPNDQTGAICAFIYDADLDMPSNALYDFEWTWNGGQYFESSVSESCPPFELPTGVEICVEATDLSGCNQHLMKCFTFPNIYTPPVIENAFINDVCGAAQNGSISLLVDGGKPPFIYNWSNGASGANNFGLGVGTYAVTITDACEYVYAGSFTVGVMETELVVNPMVTNSCSNGSTGAIELEIIEATEPLSFQWNNVDGSTTQNISSLTVGSYSVTITDGCNNTFEVSNINVLTTNTIEVLANISPVTNYENYTFDGCNGAISLTISNANNPPYAFSWSNGSTTSEVVELCNETYTVTITNGQGCEEVFNYGVPVDCKEITINASAQVATECSDGKLTLLAMNGASQGGFTFEWDNGIGIQPEFNISNLQVGTYTVTVTDGVGCTGIQSFDIAGPGGSAEVFEFVINTNACEGMDNGSAEIYLYNSPPGGYEILWDNGGTGDTNNSLSAGSHSVSITSSSNPDCVIVGYLVVPEVSPDPNFSIEADGINSCFPGSDNGDVEITMNGGNEPYHLLFSDSDGNTFPDDFGLEFAPGNYCVTVTDHCGTTASDCFEVGISLDEPWDVVLSHIKHESYPLAVDGELTVHATGNSTYSYLWNTGATTPDITGLFQTIPYTVTVTDLENEGCVIVKSFEIFRCDETSSTILPDFEIDYFAPNLGLNGDEISIGAILKDEGANAFISLPDGYSATWYHNNPLNTIIGYGPFISFNLNDYNTNTIKLRVENGCSVRVITIPLIDCENIPYDQYYKDLLINYAN